MWVYTGDKKNIKIFKTALAFAFYFFVVFLLVDFFRVHSLVNIVRSRVVCKS